MGGEKVEAGFRGGKCDKSHISLHYLASYFQLLTSREYFSKKGL